jgi:peroxiredoxin Q/BCP
LPWGPLTPGCCTASAQGFRGQKVVLYFYPKDITVGCTAEACQFNDNLRQFGAANVAVLGDSPGGAESHQKFRAGHGLTFPLLTDADHAGLRRLG